jgi:peptide/nickel transport system substrate-binding protein
MQGGPRDLSGLEFGESPELARQVATGDLPPIEERLPDHPLVLEPVEEIGIYGGSIRRWMATDVFDATIIRKTLSESLMAFERPLPKSMRLNLAEGYEILDDGRRVIVNLRQGIKWSDGVPFTVDDILFWYNDMTVDEAARHKPLFPTRWKNGGKPVRLEKKDDYTLEISAEKPLGVIFETLCHDDIALPKHIFAKYHPKYNPQSSYKRLQEYTSDATLAFEPGIPRLSAFVPSRWERGRIAEYSRNPYYWKIDPDGNQLPYADKLEFTIIPNAQLPLIKFQNGELDFIEPGSILAMYPAIKAKETESLYRLNQTTPTPLHSYFLNWDAPNPALRKAFRDLQVRIALSHAINREEINQVLAYGFLKPSGFSFSHSSPYYSERISQLYAEYDPAISNALLDEAGYHDSDGDGYREFKDGSRFQMTIDILSGARLTDISELVAEYWDAIGIKVHLYIALQEIIVPRRLNGEFDITVANTPTHPLTQSHQFGPVGPNLPFWHRKAATEGPAWLNEVTELIEKAKTTMAPEERGEFMIRIRDLVTENIPFICIGAETKIWGNNTRVGNVPTLISVEDLYRDWVRAVPHEQLFIRE